MEILVTFENRFDATFFAKVLKDTGIRCLMMPTPRTLSASGGVCAIVNDDRLVDLIKSNSEVVYQEIYEVKNNQYIKLKHS